MIKLIASDLDGTIIDSKSSICENNLKAIDDIQKTTIPFVVCTGKTYAITKDVCKTLHARYGIFGNGSQIIDLSNGEEISTKTLTIDEIKSCFAVIQKHNLHVHAYTDKSIVTTNPLYMDLRNSILFPNKIEFQIVDSVLDYIEKESTVVFKLIISSPTQLTEIKNSLEKDTNLKVTHIFKKGKYKDKIIDKEYEYLDVAPYNVTKGNALQILMKHLNIEKQDILSIGDNLNDIDMLQSSGIGAAIGSSSDEVKSVASYVTLNSVENGGFAEAIYKFIPFT